MADDDARNASMANLPSARGSIDEILDRLKGKRPVIFLDYDGTLTPIVERPEDAVLEDATRRVLRSLSEDWTVAVVSGRDLDDVRRRVGLETVFYAGSHGFHLAGPDGWRHEHAEGHAFLEALDEAERRLRRALDTVPGAQVERKRYAVAVHFRRVGEECIGRVAAAVDRVAECCRNLRKTGGKKIFELRPNVDWHKGKAVLWMLDTLGFDRGDVVAFYIGDDDTDEDAFEALTGRGIGIVVGNEDRPTWAQYRLKDPGAVRTFLEELAEGLRRVKA